MSYSAQDLFGDLSDLDGFSDDDTTNYNKKKNSKRKNNYFPNENFIPNKKIRKDTWKSKSSNLGVNDSKNETVIKDIYSGIRVTKPLVSSDELKILMQGRKMIKLSLLNSHINKTTNNIDDDNWVTMGVIVNKSTKVSKNGRDFSIWVLSDMKSEKTVSFFLFGSVHDKHWKLPVGSVIGLLNASFLNNNNNSKKSQKNSEIGPITINDPDQLLHVGTSKDLGHCKALKKNGEICGSLIIRADDEFCLYHIKNAYRKFSSNRPEIQSNFANKEPEQYHFANNFQPNSSLSQNNIIIAMKSIKKGQFFNKKEDEIKNLEKIISNPLSRSAKNLAAFSQQQQQKSQPIDNKKESLLKPMKEDFSLKDNGLPKLAKGYGKGQMIDLQVSSLDFKKASVDPIKQRAIEIFKRKKQEALEQATNNKNNNKLAQILKRVDNNLDETNEEFQKEKAQKEKNDLIEEAMKRKSINSNLVDVVENKAQQQHFKMLEKREKYEERLAEIKELDVKVVTCNTCKYTAVSQSDLCKSKNHSVKFHQAKKRFFQCKKCHYRRFTYDSIYPSSDCPNCGQISFEKTSIINIRTETKLGKELLVRGEEIKFINGLR